MTKITYINNNGIRQYNYIETDTIDKSINSLRELGCYCITIGG